MSRIDGSVMPRPSVDWAVHQMLSRQDALLRDVRRSGGRDNYDHLKSHGHHMATISRAIRQGYLVEVKPRTYMLTEAGGRAIFPKDDPS